MKNNDEAIIELAKTGSEKAFTVLYNAYHKSIRRNIYNIVKNIDVADDLTSETFLKAFKNIHTFTKNISFEMWLKTIANRHSIDFIRSENRNKDLVYIDNEDLAEFVYTDYSNPEKDLISKELFENYEGELNKLSNRSKQVLIMRYKDELSYQEIADKIGIKIGTVKHYIHKYSRLLISNIHQSS